MQFKASKSRRRTILSGSAAALLATVLSHPGFAATYSWDGGDTATSGAQGGAGTWDTNSTANWWNGAADVVWPLASSGSDVAVFAGNPGTVTISGGVTANQLVFNTTGYSLTGGTLTLDGASPAVTVATGLTSTIGSLISGSVGLSKSGGGTLYLTGTASTYTGVTTIAGGILNLAKLANGGVNSSLGAASNAAANLVIDSGTLQYTGAAAQSSDRLVTVGLGGATFESSGGGAVTLSSTGSIGYNGAGSRTITFGGTYTGGVNQFGGMIANSGGPTSIVKTGPGTWLLGVTSGSSNTYTGSTTILSGTLIGGAANGQQGFGSTSAIYLGDTSGSSNAGVQFGTGVATAFNSIPIVVQTGNSGTSSVLEYTNASVNSTVTLGSPNSAGKSVTITNIGNYQWIPAFTGVIQDPTGLTGSPGTVIFNNACTGGGTSANFFINGANTYTGDTRLLFGVVTVGNSNALQYSTLDLGYSGDVGSVVWYQDSTLGGLKGSRNLDTSGKTLSIGYNNQNTAYSGILSGSGALTKIGTGTLTLSGSESYTGATKINAGTLKIDAGAGGALPVSSPLTMAGGTFSYDNTTASGAKNTGLGALTLSSGENNLTLTRTALQPVTLTFSSLAARPTGVIGNFAYGGTPGTLGTDSAINLTGAAAGFMSQGFFCNGGSASSDFAWMNGTGTYVRGINYGTDSNSESVSASTAAFTPGQLYEKISGAGAITSQTTQTITSLAISNANDLTLAGGATLTVNGILKSGNAAGGSITGGAGIQAASGAELVVRTDQASDTLTIATPILANGASSLTKSGAGTLTLSGSLLYSGTTCVDAGTLTISGTNLYAGPTAIRAGGTLVFGYAGNLTLSGSITGSGNLSKLTSGTLTLSTAPVLTGTTSVSTGVISVSSLLGLSFIAIDNGGTFSVTNGTWGGNTVTFGANGGTLQINNINFYYSGGAAMNIITTAGGAASQLLGSSLINLNNGTMNFNIGGDLNVTAPIRNAGTVNKSGTGMLILSGAASNDAYSLFLNAGTVRVNDANALGNSSTSGAITFAGGRLQYNVASPVDRSSRIKNSTGAISVDTNGQNIAWSGTLDSTNTGGLVKSGGGSLTLSASNSFSGGVTVNSGTLTAGNASALSSTTGALSINGGALNLGGYSIAVGALSGSSGATITTSTAAGTATLTTSISSGASTYAGVIADNGSGLVALVKNGAGTLTLSGSNSYSGGTVVNAGVLAVSSSAALPGWSTAGQLTVNSGAGLSVGNGFSDSDISTLLTTGSNFRAGAAIGFDTSAGNRAFAASLADTAQGALGMVKTGANTLTLSASNSFTGGLTLTSGSLAVSGAGTLGATSGALTITGAVLDLGSTSQTVGAVALSGGVIQSGSLSAGSYAIQSGTVSAALAGSATLSMSGALLLTGTNTYTGATTITSGTLTIGGAGDLGGGSYSGNLSNAGALIFNSSAAQTLSGIISGIGSVTQSGAGTLTLSGSNTYTGGLTVNSGSLAISGTGKLGAASNALAVNGGVLDLGSTSQTAGAVTIVGGVIQSGTLTGSSYSITGGAVSATLAGSASLTKSGTGTMTLSGPNTYSGTNTVSTGTLAISGAGKLGATSNALTVNGGVLDLGSTSQTAGAVTIGGGVIQSGTLTGSSYSATSGAVSASLAGSGALTKTGPGSLTLSGPNSYSGATTVSGGVLTLANLSGTNTIGAVTVSGGTAGATLNVNGATSLGSNSITVGNASGDRSVANLAANIGLNSLDIGNVAGSAGVAYVTSGSVNIAAANSNFAQNGYGYFKVSGGTVSGAALWQGGNGGSPTGVGVFAISGGLFTSGAAQPFVLGGVNSGGNAIGVLNMDGGSVNIGNTLGVGWSTNSGGRGEVNVTSGTLTANQFQFNGNATGVLNLRGGVLNTQSVSTTVYNNSNATGYLNLNGGTLQAAQNGAALINLSTTNARNNVFIYSGGATIDTNGYSVSIANALNAPTGNGLSAIALTGSGAGYIGEPYVQITGGGGSGATARATIDPATGMVTGIVITNPGTGYTSTPTVSLVGGGSTTAATLGTVSLAANTSGGLTKIGAGMLTLNGSNNYTGPTMVNAGTLQAGSTSAFGSNPVVTLANVAGATLDLNGYSNTIVSLSGGGSSGGNVTLGSGTLTLGGDNSSTSFGGSIGGTGGVVKTGSGTLTLTGTSYTAPITVSSGALTVNLAASGTVAASILNYGTLNVLGGGTTTLAGNITGYGSGGLNLSGSGVTILGGNNTYTGPTNTNSGVLKLNWQYAAMYSTVNVGASNGLAFSVTPVSIGGLAGSGDVSLLSGTTGVALTVGGNNANTAYSGALSGSGASLSKVGTGTLTLSGPNSYSGATTVSGGALTFANLTGTNTIGAVTVSGGAAGATLNVNGATSLGSGTNSLTVGSASGDRSVANLAANVGLNSLDIGNGAGSAGAAYITSGSVNIAATASYFAQNGYGYFKVSGGTVSGAALWQGGMGGSPNGVGVITVSGGSYTTNATQPFVLGGVNTSGGNPIGVLNVDGGLLNIGQFLTTGFSTNPGGRGEANITSGTLAAAQFQFRGNATGVLNLRGGVLNVQSVSTDIYLNSNATGYVNFNGGTLQANQNNAVLINLVTTNAQNNLFVYSGGATIDTNGYSVSIANALNAPTGNGLSSIALTGSGAGYIGEPYVQITGGGGSGATARATIDPVTGTVTGIVITNPGTGYTSTPTVSLVGGGSTAAATVGTVSLAANVGGGLTKIGAGMLTLSGSNNYTGPTMVNSGTLQAGSSAAFGCNPAISLANVAGAVLDLNGYSNTIASLSGGGSTGGNVALGSGTLTVGSDNSSSTYGGSFGGTGRVVKTGSGILTLTGSNNLNGGLTVNSGVLDLGSKNQTFGAVTIAGGLIQSGTLTGSSYSGQSGTVSASLAGSGALTKTGTGTLTLSGPNSYSGSTTVSGGVLTLANVSGTNSIGAVTVSGGAAGATLNVNGATSLGSGSSSLTVGSASGDRSVVNIAGNLGMGTLGIGNVTGGAGAFYLTSGTVTRTSPSYGGGGAEPFAQSGYGYMKISGGLLTGVSIWQSGQNGVSPGTGVITQSGGSVLQNATQPFVLGGVNCAGGTGVFNMDGGTMTVPGTIGVGWTNNTGGRGELNITAGSVTAHDFYFYGATTGMLNLLGGTLSLNSINNGSLSYAQSAYTTGYVNFNGGTLQATQNGAALISLSATNTQNNVFIYSGGATIDTNANSVSIANPLNAPTGNGLSSIALTGSGAGYIGEPYVQITGGGGSGATARATIDPVTGTVTGIVITNPGTGYTSTPTVSLVGGGSLTAATVGTVSLAANVGGGLTKIGAGMLTLSGTNTFTGDTIVNSGTLRLTNNLALQNSAFDTSGAGWLALTVATPTFGGLKGATALATAISSGYSSVSSLTLNPASGVTNTYSGAIANGASGMALVKNGAGTQVLTGSNSYSGGTTVSNGTLQIGNANALGTGGLTVNSGTLELHGNSVSVAAFSGSGGAITNMASGTSTLTTSVASGTATYAGNIANGAGAVALTKSGTGTLVLSGSLSMAGLNANGGVTQLTQSGSIGAVSVAAGATLSMAAHSGSTYNVLDVSTLAISGFTSGLALADGAAIDSPIYTCVDTDSQSQTYGALTEKGAVIVQTTGATGDLVPASPEAVPEPGTLGLLLASAVGMLGFRRKAKRSAR